MIPYYVGFGATGTRHVSKARSRVFFSGVTKRAGVRVNSGRPAANPRDKPLLAILARSRYAGHTSCGTSLLHAVMPMLK